MAIYHREFKASDYLKEPYVIVGVNAFVSDTDEEAKRLATSQKQGVLSIVTGNPKGILPPKDEEKLWNDYIAATKVPHFGAVAFEIEGIVNREREVVERMTGLSLIGNKDTVTKQLKELQDKVQFDEIIVNSFIYDQGDQIKSYQLLSEVINEKF